MLTVPAVAQSADLPGGPRRVDPFLDPVVRALVGTRLAPIVISMGAHRRDDDVWQAIEQEPLALPESSLAERWADPADEPWAEATAAGVRGRLAELPRAPVDIAGIDLSPLVRAELLRLASSALPGRLRNARRVRRMLGDLRPSGLLLYNEYGRLDWVVGARDAGVPVFAVQHGIVYPGHLGYAHARTPELLLPRRTFVFGPYEAEVLLEHGGYTRDEVTVTGAPRLAFVPGGAAAEPIDDAGREAVRRSLGVRPGNRMVVISTTHEPIHRRFYWPHALARLLSGELPGVHLVFKQHPGESDDGGYRRLVEGIARQAGVVAPPVSVVREADLYTLLRAADAHLGLYSTVLTDAVAAGSPNLVATTQARRDLLGYVDAGVAVAVSSAAELRAAIEAASPPQPEARAAFLARHFAPGDAPSRIREALLVATEPHGAPQPNELAGAATSPDEPFPASQPDEPAGGAPRAR